MEGGIRWTWQKIAGTILGVLGIGTLTSCYGMPENTYTIRGTVKGKIDGVTMPIEGIEVKVTDSDGYYGREHTDSSGNFTLEGEFEGTYEISLTDVDGTENGSFKEKKIENVLLQDDKDLGEITLENSDAE